MKIKALESKNVDGVMYQEGKEYEVDTKIDLKYEEIKEIKKVEVKVEAPKKSDKKKGDK